MDIVSKYILVGSGGSGAIYAGGVAGVDYQLFTAAQTSNFTTSIAHPAVGYTGRLDIFMIGTGMNCGNYWDSSSDVTYGAPGEGAYWQYQCLGDETGFELQQENYGISITTSCRLILRIIGGARNNQTFIVGSGGNNNTGYGNGGAQPNLSTSSTPTGSTLIAYGCTRQSYTAYYSDNTAYGPAQYPQYGSGASVNYTFNSSPTTLNMGYGASMNGMTYNGTYYGFGNFTSAGYSAGRHPNSRGGCLLVFKNNN
jgi:hypothetical protein